MSDSIERPWETPDEMQRREAAVKQANRSFRLIGTLIAFTIVVIVVLLLG